jgi:hypothetical protein
LNAALLRTFYRKASDETHRRPVWTESRPTPAGGDQDRDYALYQAPP